MNFFLRTLAIFAAVLLWQAPAHADLDQIKQAAEAGDAESQLELGILFEYGFNYKDNEIPALTWYMISANQGNAKAASLRDKLRAKMTAKDVTEAEGQVAQFKPKGQLPPPAAPAPSSPPPAEAAPAAAPAAEAPVPAPQPAAPTVAAPAPSPAPAEPQGK
jgi:TPR repeat protein